MIGRIGRIGLMALALGLCAGCVAVPKTRIVGTICGQPFELSSPKDADLQGLSITALTNGAVQISVQRLTSRMNPEVITTTAEGQVKLIQAAGDVGARAMAAGIDAAKKP